MTDTFSASGGAHAMGVLINVARVWLWYTAAVWTEGKVDDVARYQQETVEGTAERECL
jgi:hypothetical protein